MPISPFRIAIPSCDPSHQLAVVRVRGAWLAVSLVVAVGLQDLTSAERVERERWSIYNI